MTGTTSPNLTTVRTGPLRDVWLATRVSLLTAATLAGSIALTFVFINISAGWVDLGRPIMGGVVGIGAELLLPLLGGGLWGLALARLFHAADPRRVTKASGLTFGISVFLGSLVLLGVNLSLGPFYRLVPNGPPIHVLFMGAWSAVAGLLAGINAGRMAHRLGRRGRIGLAVGIAGGLAFLGMALLLHQQGWHVGGYPSKPYKMSIVAVLSNLAASLAGGAVMGALLARDREPAPADDALLITDVNSRKELATLSENLTP